MKSLNYKRATTLTIAVCCCVFVVQPVKAQTEADALAAIKLATNPTTKLAAAEDFIAKFPQSRERVDVAKQIAAELFEDQERRGRTRATRTRASRVHDH